MTVTDGLLTEVIVSGPATCYGPVLRMFTQRHSVANSVGCFQQRLFVSLFVCLSTR